MNTRYTVVDTATPGPAAIVANGPSVRGGRLCRA